MNSTLLEFKKIPRYRFHGTGALLLIRSSGIPKTISKRRSHFGVFRKNRRGRQGKFRLYFHPQLIELLQFPYADVFPGDVVRARAFFDAVHLEADVALRMSLVNRFI